MTTLQVGKQIKVGNTTVSLQYGDDLKYMIVCDKHDYCLEDNNKQSLWLSAKDVEIDWCEACKGNDKRFPETYKERE
jgi:hypothetical protein